MKKPEQIEIAQKIKKDLEKTFVVDYDISGSIGKRYLRSSTIGTPFCITVDPETADDNKVTIRDRDTTEQKRIAVDEVKDVLRKLISGELRFKDLK